MYARWLKIVRKTVPSADLADILEETSQNDVSKRQFAPLYSQNAYTTILDQERQYSDYTSCRALKVTKADREQMFFVIEKIHEIKEYKIETMFSAMSIADRYLEKLAQAQIKAPCLVTLGITSLLMAVKIEEPISPSFERMINLLKKYDINSISKQDLIDLEEQIIVKLDFCLRDVSPI